MTRSYRGGRTTVTALERVNLTIVAGEFAAVMGPSGSGKSTLLQCASGLDRPDEGTVSLAGADLGRLSEVEVTRLRRDRVGFVFQGFNLLPTLTAAQNVELPLLLAGRRARRGDVRSALAAVGLHDRSGHRPAQLSGGQQQRVAIARALVGRPAIVFADEPTGALDPTDATRLLDLLASMNRRDRVTVVIVTHDPAVPLLVSFQMLVAVPDEGLESLRKRGRRWIGRHHSRIFLPGSVASLARHDGPSYPCTQASSGRRASEPFSADGISVPPTVIYLGQFRPVSTRRTTVARIGNLQANGPT